MPTINGVINKIYTNGLINKLFITKEGIEGFTSDEFKINLQTQTKINSILEVISEIITDIQTQTQLNATTEVLSELSDDLITQSQINASLNVLEPVGGYQGFNQQKFNRIEVI
ncbi:MAG TPA: hypothetical protein VK982_07945 [Bacteroidales bacterium]|nr:hypothetical protein [Bacteroidales bacterium]